MKVLRIHIQTANWRRVFHLQFAAIICVLATSTIGIAQNDPFPPELVHWEPWQQSPVFTGAGTGHWDAKIRERGWILKEGETWNMWYTGYDGTRTGVRHLGYATSTDGLHWTRFAQHPIHDERWVEDVNVVKVGDVYYMFAEGLNDHAQLLTSRDRVHWTWHGFLDVRLVNGQAIPEGPFGTPAAIYENKTWYLLYERRDQGVWLAKSQDLRTWHNVQDDPVLSLGQEGAYDSKMIAVNQILKYKDRYYIVYHGSRSSDKPSLWTTCLAASHDLINWTRYSGNPLRPESENKSSGLLIHDGQQFRLYTMHDAVHVHFPPKATSK